MRTFSNEVTAAKNAMQSSTPWVWLAKLEINPVNTLYLTNSDTPVDYDGHSWTPFPFDLGSQTEDGEGNLSGVQMNVATISQAFIGELRRNYGFTSKRATLYFGVVKETGFKLTMRQTFRIGAPTYNDTVGSFPLGYQNLFKFSFPARRFSRTRCPLRFKSDLCGYVGVIASCDFSLDGNLGCMMHFLPDSNPIRGLIYAAIPRAA